MELWIVIIIAAALWATLGITLRVNYRLIKENTYLLNKLHENEIPILINWKEEARKK